MANRRTATRESHIEHHVNDYARSLGWYPIKLQAHAGAQKGLPDRLYLKNSVAVFIEFKSKGKRPTPLQHHVHDEIRAKAFEVFVIDNILKGEELFDAIELGFA